ncbi:MAG: hypothetical protein R8M38_05170, partial [Mariprofundaceae bacterium]
FSDLALDGPAITVKVTCMKAFLVNGVMPTFSLGRSEDKSKAGAMEVQNIKQQIDAQMEAMREAQENR